MSQRLLRKSRSNQGDNSQSISHTSPVYHDEQIKNFRVDFSDLSRKRLSDSGEIRDPTIYSHRKSRLSQFSQINRQREVSEHNQHQLTGVTKQYQKWKELSGLPKHTNMQQIIITFLNKLKRNANIWDQQTLLQENYLQNPPKMQDSHMWYIRQSFSYIRQISYFTVALSANNFMNIWIQSFIIIILLAEFIDSILKFRAIRVMLVCNLVYIISTLILNFEISLQIKQALLITSSLGVINSYQWNLITYVTSFCNYINYFANLRLIFLNDGTYIESIIWVMNNCLPFSTIETSNYDEQVMTIIIQAISFFLQIFFIAIIVKNFFSVDEVNIFTTYLKNNKVNQHLIEEASDILILNTHPNSLQIVQFISKQIHNLFSQLPYTLQKPLFALIKSKRLKEIAFLTRYFTQESIDGLANEAVLKFYTANQIIVEKGELNELIYVVLQGEACIYDKDVFLQNLPMNQAIGIENLLSNQGHNMTIRCKGSSIVISLTHTQFMNVIKKKKCDLEAYHSIKNELLFQNKVDLLCQSCYICGSKLHLSSNCNRVHSLLNRQLVISRFLHSIPCQRKKVDRRWETRVNSLYNLKLVKSCGMRYKKNYGIIPTDSQDEVEEEDDADYDNYYGRLSYKDLSNPSRVTSSNIEKQKSVEIVSGQTLKDIIYHDHIDNEEQLQYYQQLWQQQQEINRHPVVKQTIQTAGFQQQGGDDLYFGEAGINLPLQHKTFTQNSNTFKSSSGQYSANTYQSQKSQQIKQQNQQQQQNTHQSKTYVQSPLGTNQLLVANNRNAQPKLTFSYDPFYYEQGKTILPAPQPEYSTMLRPQYRSQTNYIPSGGQQLPIVSEESSSSQLNLPFVNMPYASAMSISSVGISSIDDAVQRREQQNNTYTGVRRMTQKQTNTNTNTMVSAVSPDTKKKSVSGSNSRSYSALSSRQNQHYSDLDNVLNRIELKDNFDIDQVEIYNQFKPQNNYDCVVNQFKIQTNKLIRKKKRQK